MDSLTPYNPFKDREKNSPFTQEQLDFIKQLLDSGWSISKVAKEYNVGIDSLRRRQKSDNWAVKRTQRKKKLTQSELDDIKQMLEDNIPIQKISELFNISEAAILRRKGKNLWTNTPRKNKYSFDEHFFDDINSEHKAYWLGFLMADGYILSKRKGKRANQSQSFGFAISMMDAELFDYFKSDLKADNPVNVYVNTSTSFASTHPYGRILLTSQHTVDTLKRWGVVENKTFITKMPNIPNELMPAFIRGYSDGDGSIVVDKNNRVSWGFCGTKELLNSIQGFFGLNYKLSQRFPERNNNNWQLKITGWQNVPACLDIAYKDATIYLERKYNKYVEIQGKSV